MKKITFFLTEFCNKNCSYCDIPHIKNKNSTSLSKIKNIIPIIKQSITYETEIRLTGGEIGFVSSDIIDYIFENFKNISINTNGYFLKKYPHYIKQCKRIFYHPSESFIKSDEYICLDNIIYQFPIHSLNKEDIKKITNEIPKEKISLLFYDDKFTTNRQFKLKDCDILSIKKICEELNFNDTDFYKTFLYISTIHDIRKTCKKTAIEPSIDFVNNRIKQCVCSHTRSSFVDLTEKNLQMLFEDTLFFNETSLCDDCFHCVKNFDLLIKNQIRRILKK